MMYSPEKAKAMYLNHLQMPRDTERQVVNLLPWTDVCGDKPGQQEHSFIVSNAAQNSS